MAASSLTLVETDTRQTRSLVSLTAEDSSQYNNQQASAPKHIGRKVMPKHVLVVSYDESALTTRETLLSHAGYKVTAALGLSSAREWCKKGRFDLIVMGHTIPPKDKRALIEEARRFSDVPVLSIRRHGDARLAEADYSIDSLEGSAALVSAVHAVLAARAQSEERPEESLKQF